MRVIRVSYKSSVFYAALHEDSVVCLHSQLGLTEPIPLTDVSILPLVTPSKVICVGLNYREHAKEVGFPIPKQPSFFLKPPSSIIGNGQPIVLPPRVGRIEHEAELALVIGQLCRDVTSQNASKYIFGYTCANDVTARELQKEDPLIGHCKSYDTFCPIGPWIETEIPYLSNVAVRCLVNGKVRQEGLVGDMICQPLDLISYLSRIMTLLPGDVILTGTPPGVGEIKAGDLVHVDIEGVGVLFNTASEPRPEENILQ